MEDLQKLMEVITLKIKQFQKMLKIDATDVAILLYSKNFQLISSRIL